MSSRAIADRLAWPSGPSRRPRRGPSTSAAVVGRAGQRVAPGRLDQLVGLAADPGLGGAEDEEQDERRHEPGRQRDHDHVLAHRAETRGDRLAVAPDADHGQDAVAVLEREVLAQERFRREGRAERLGRRRAGERRGRRAGDRLGEVGTGSPQAADRAEVVGCDDVPSGRRISIRVMPPGDSRSWSGRWMLAASDEVVAPGSRSLAVSFSLTSARTVAASPPTTASRIDWEYVVETSTACARAVIPTIIRNTPKTRRRRIGFRGCARVPSTVGRLRSSVERTRVQPDGRA